MSERTRINNTTRRTLEKLRDRLMADHDLADELDADYVTPFAESVAISDLMKSVEAVEAENAKLRTLLHDLQFTIARM